MKKFKVFLASSEDLKIDSHEFSDIPEHMNHIMKKPDRHTYLSKWESLQSKPDNDSTLDSNDISLVVFDRDFGSYSEEELIDPLYKLAC